jgi:membrane protease subunit HflC
MNKVILVVLGVVAIVAGVVGFDAFYTVNQTQQALVLQFGRPISVESSPGLHVKVPLLQDVEYFDKRILNLDPPAQEVILADQKRINVNAFVRFRIKDPLKFKQRATTILNFLQIFGGRLNASVRAEVGTVLLGDMLSEKRDDIMRRITQKLTAQAPEFGVEVVDVRIGRTDLPDTTSQSVYNRMRSERVAQAAQLRAEGAEIKARIQAEADRERTVIIAEAQRESQILRGQGEGARTRILNDAFGKDPEFFGFYRSMEAYNSALSDGTTMVLSPNSEFFRYFRELQGVNPSRPAN